MNSGHEREFPKRSKVPRRIVAVVLATAAMTLAWASVASSRPNTRGSGRHLDSVSSCCESRFFLAVRYEVSEEGEGLYAAQLPLEEGATKEKVHVLFVGNLQRVGLNSEDEAVEEEEIPGPYAIPEGMLENVLLSTPEVTPYELGGGLLMTGELDGPKSVTLDKVEPLNHGSSQFELFYSWGAL